VTPPAPDGICPTDPKGMPMSEPDGLTREFETPQPVRLRIEAGSGVIRVDAVDGGRTVVRLRPARGGGDKALDLIRRTTIEHRGDEVIVDVPRAGIGFLRSSPEVDIAVSVPSGSILESTAKSADLRTSGHLDAVRSRSGSGDVSLAHVGEAHVQAGSGDTVLDRADRSVHVETGSGDVRLKHIEGALEVNTASGDVHVDAAGGDVSINTASGDHYVGRVRRGTVKINSASGDVEVAVIEGTAVWLDVTSLTGTVHSTLEGSGPPADGEDAVALHVNTVSGDISLSHG